MGDWYLGPDPDRPGQMKWLYDSNAPTPDPTVTSMLPTVSRETSRPAATVPGFVKDDGSAYARVDPGWFDSFDEVDSRSIVDDGGPPDAT